MSNNAEILIPEETSETQLLQLDEIQEKYFFSNKTRSVEFRIEQLKKLKSALQSHLEEIYQSLRLDLGKSKREAYVTEISSINSEIAYFTKNLKELVPTPRDSEGFSIRTPSAPFHV